MSADGSTSEYVTNLKTLIWCMLTTLVVGGSFFVFQINKYMTGGYAHEKHAEHPEKHPEKGEKPAEKPAPEGKKDH